MRSCQQHLLEYWVSTLSGSDLLASMADMVLVDPEGEVVPEDANMESKVRWTPYRGWKLTGKPVATILRGTVIAENGKIVQDQGYGRYVGGVSQ